MRAELLNLRTTCAQNGVALGEHHLAQLEKFSELLLEWNKKINLVSRRDAENVFITHILHSLTILFKLDIPEHSKVLDLGTGGGLPGIPIKIIRPDLSLTLLDSTQKKINVVRAIVKELGLEGADAVWGRAEELGNDKKFMKRCDLVLARAVAPLRDLVKWSIPFLKESAEDPRPPDEYASGKKTRVQNQMLIALKGGDLRSEIEQIENHPRVQRVSVIDLTLAGTTQLAEGEKKIVLVDLRGTKKAT